MRINGERLISDLEEFRLITATPGEGVTRFSYSNEDIAARERIRQMAEGYNMICRTDQTGNMIIGPEKSKRVILFGSHIDTVKNGGWLDGIYGVISGLEILRTFYENGIQHDCALIIFAEEEGSNFGATMTGSKFITGKYSTQKLDQLVSDKGETMRSVLQKTGFFGQKQNERLIDIDLVKAMFEIHVEQGPVLYDEGLEIGIVHAVAGMKVIQTVYEGLGNHAGASPMAGRKDAFVAVAEAAVSIERMIRDDPEKSLVGTMGKIFVYPNCSNVIPEKAFFTFEVRSENNNKTEAALNKAKEIIRETAARRKIKCSISNIASSDAIPMSEDIKSTMENIAREKGLRYKIMNSGAVHDAAMMAGYIDTGMVFVPSINGRSHVPEEDTQKEHLTGGTQFLMDVIREYI
ncbi:MAG TPA: Zn-dependent hydrolase [Bacillota bacterium]|nr:Zn-dependent hydrolase [Bacillota bacterium]